MDTTQITDWEFETHVYPLAMENWLTDQGLLEGERPLTDAEYTEIAEWAQILRQSFNSGEQEMSWR